MGPLVSISYNSRDITFSEWVSLTTLCLSPLLFHLWAGLPQFAILSKTQPRWIDKLVHLSPTSIFWRYYSITVRRARAEKWDVGDLAAANTAFWIDGRRWEGSEIVLLVDGQGVYITRQPEKGRLSLGAGIKTLVVTAQGVQAIWDITPVLRPGNWELYFSLPTLFLVFAVYGLPRLAAALWITDDCAYSATGEPGQRIECLRTVLKPDSRKLQVATTAIGLGFLAYMTFFLGIAVYYFTHLFTETGVWTWSGTNLMVDLICIVFTSVSVAVSAYHMYMLRGEKGTTVLPCIQSTWYKMYTLALFAMMGVAFVFACIETGRKSCAGSALQMYASAPSPAPLKYFDQCFSSWTYLRIVNSTVMDVYCGTDRRISFHGFPTERWPGVYLATDNFFLFPLSFSMFPTQL